jgi:hypothetical protein
VQELQKIHLALSSWMCLRMCGKGGLMKGKEFNSVPDC